MIVLKLFTVSSSSHPVSADSSNQDNNCHIDRNRDPDCDNVEDNSDPLFSLGRIIITGPLVISCLQNKTFINFNYSNCKYCKGTNFCGVNFAEHTPVAKFNHRLLLMYILSQVNHRFVHDNCSSRSCTFCHITLFSVLQVSQKSEHMETRKIDSTVCW